MPLSRPTLGELRNRAEQELAARLGLSTLIPQGPAAAIAAVIAGQTHSLLGAIAYEVDQVWPDTCNAANLDVWGARLSLPRKASVAASGTISIAGTTGTTVAAGSLVQRADGRRFATQAAVTLLGGAALVRVVASQAGYAGNTAPLTALSMASSVTGTVTGVTVDDAGLDGGADEEGDDPFRARLVQRFAAAPGVGTAADYERWALEVPGVTRAWVLPGNQGAGTVGLAFVLDDDPISIVPTATKVAEVQAYIDARRPAEVSFLAFAPALTAVNFTIEVTPDTTAVRDAVAASLEDLFLREGAPGTTIPLSHVREAISLAPGETDHVLTVPAADIVIGSGTIAVVGTITWV
jgi:uncharacterized phage protein gp47/JayE